MRLHAASRSQNARKFWRNMHDTDAFSKFTPYFKVNTV